MESGSIFAGTAQYYAQYRPRYPEELFSLLRDTFGLNARSRVLDLGCGPGPLSLRLAPQVERVIAIDPNREMLAEGKRLAGAQNVDNIDWLTGESGQLSAFSDRIGDLDLTVMGRSFHWMDREQTLRDLYCMTKPGGGVAVIDDSGPAGGKPAPWRELTWEVIREWLGEERRSGVNRVYSHPKEEHGKILRQSSFRDYESVQIPVERTSTLDEVIGGLFSTSHCAPPVLGDLKDGFEADLRKRLLELDPSGLYQEKVVVEVKIVRK